MLVHQRTMMWKSFTMLKFTMRLIGFVSDFFNIGILMYLIFIYDFGGTGFFGLALEGKYHG